MRPKRMERLFLQLINKKLISFDKFLPLNNQITLNLPFFSPPPPPTPPTKISEKIFRH